MDLGQDTGSGSPSSVRDEGSRDFFGVLAALDSAAPAAGAQNANEMKDDQDGVQAAAEDATSSGGIGDAGKKRKNVKKRKNSLKKGKKRNSKTMEKKYTFRKLVG